MAALLPPGEIQFCDGNGFPYAGGSVWTYVPGTTTPKTTWKDSGGVATNTNPIVLDLSGRAIIYGDGIYRQQLFDGNGNLIWDQLTNSLVSAAMAPVCIAADLPTALAAMGVTAAIAAEAALRAAADATLTTTAGGAATATAAETTRATAAEATITASVTTERTRALAAEAAITAGAAIPKVGSSGVTDSTGHLRVTYPTAFATQTLSVATNVQGSGLLSYSSAVQADRFGFDLWMVRAGSSTPLPGATFYWVAYGN